ncbi:NAD(P)-dependent oxidoreductase [Paraclostridium bifermentans]|uniref:NAD-dependent epimerase/dehydratase family protein n=2 Tax=Paraclostridium bifermentans TaxID=1490 RepID=UPI003065E40A|nr:NAD(P)-dependent oxidoreductase [Paraclostridium bifermentans]
MLSMEYIDNKLKINEGTYFITGITGFIGSIITKAIIKSDNYKNGKIKIIGLVRDIDKALEMYSNFDQFNLKFIKGDLINVCNMDLLAKIDINNIDYIFHCAATTKSSEMILRPVETADGIVIGTKNILNIAKRYNVSSMVYISSMEVYGVISSDGDRTDEKDIGTIDILSERSCYPLGKQMAEHYCFSYYKEYGVPVKIARLAQTFGEGTLKDDTRVFSQFAKCVIENKDIVLHTNGDSVGNYVESSDAVSALFILLNYGINGEAYNIANEESTMTVFEMAELVANEIANRKIKVTFDIPESNIYGYAKKTELRLSSSKIRDLGWEPKYNMKDMYEKIISRFNN